MTAFQALAEHISHYEDRPSQREMAGAVADALAHAAPLFVEAGTGTGKTLAYLVPALESRKRVVISTATKALQEQIAFRDLPLAKKIVGTDAHFALVKGVSNYVCRRRWSEVSTLEPNDPDVAEVRAWLRGTAAGDKAELTRPAPDAAIWRRITTESDGRQGGACPHYEKCFVTGARKNAENAHIVVVNHHLFLADLMLRSRSSEGLLPDYGAVIFDEAHQLEDNIAAHFGATVSSGRLQSLLRDAATILGRDRVPPAVEKCHEPQRAFFSAVDTATRTPEAENRTSIRPEDFAGDVTTSWYALDDALDNLERQALGDAQYTDPNYDGLSRLAARVARAREDLALVVEQTDESRVYWAERNGDSLQLRAALVDASPVLPKHLFPVTESVVFTSATLSTGGGFAFSRNGLGVEQDQASELSVPSPFDYATQCRLYLPRDLPAPGCEDFLPAASERIKELVSVTGGRALVLFASHRSLRVARKHLSGNLSVPLLCQGDGPSGALLDVFRQEPSVLIGTGTFWEGIDVPGDALSLLIIEKIPFSSPSDPVERARLEALERRGQDPFEGRQIPKAALALKQGFGRLIRRRGDRGIAAILDVRLLGKQYGRPLLAALPKDIPRTSSLEQIRRFWVAAQ